MKSKLVIDSRGNYKYYLENSQYIYHRIDGPAIIYEDGMQEWWINGLLHREDGPAVEFVKYNYKIWSYQGERINCNSQEEFERIIKLKIFW